MSETLHIWLDSISAWFLEFGIWGLAVVSFLESSFFPVIPEVILIPLSLANIDMALVYGLVTTISSVAGALLGYWIGRRAGRPVLDRFFGKARIEKVEREFNKRGGAAIAIAGFTPIPYKVFTIMAGVCRIPKRELVVWSFIGRGARFMLEAGFIVVLGPVAVPILKEYFGLITFIVTAAIVIPFVVYKYINRKKPNGEH